MTTLIVDGMNLSYRIKFTSGVDEKFSLVEGFLETLYNHINELSPTSVIVVWDGGSPAYRKLLHPDYKKGRKKSDKEEMTLFYNQLDTLRDIIPALGLNQIFKWGIEADDLMYHTSRLVDDEVIILSSDADMLQAVNNRVSVYQPMKKMMVTLDTFEELVGVSPDKFIDFKILTGDKSDNILGIDGVGQKTAIDLFSKFDSIADAITKIKDGFEMPSFFKNKILSIDPDELKRLYNLMSLETDRFGAKSISYKCLMEQETKPVSKILLFNLGTMIGKYKNLYLHKPNISCYNKPNEIILNRW